MNKHDRAKLLNRFGALKLVEGISIKDSYIVFNWVAREVDRATRAERMRQQELRNVCHDCKVVMIDEGPPLCEGCVSKRGDEGMNREDWRTLERWMKT